MKTLQVNLGLVLGLKFGKSKIEKEEFQVGYNFKFFLYQRYQFIFLYFLVDSVNHLQGRKN